MKTNYLVALSAAAAIVGALVPQTSHSQTLPIGLSGEISANPDVVSVNQKTKLSWKINYPSVVKTYVDIVPPGGSGGSGPGTITLKEKLGVDIRMIGQGVVTAAYTKNSKRIIMVPTEGSMSINSESDNSFAPIFFGINTDINPADIRDLSSVFGNNYKNNIIQSGKILRFSGRYIRSGQWSNRYKSNAGDNVRFLVHGDIPPNNIPKHGSPSLESFLRPYLDTTGKVKIGPMDVIIFMELTHTSAQKSDKGYDLQDLILLATFRKL